MKIAAPKWDLSDLYKGIADPKIAKDKAKTEKLTASFIKNYKNKIKSLSLTPKTLLRALNDREQIELTLLHYLSFASLLHSTNTSSPKVGHFYQEAREFGNKIQTQLIWFELEWLEIPKVRAQKLLKSPLLSKHKHYLAHTRVFKPFTLNESEEIIMSKKSQSGGSAFVRLYDELQTSLEFELKIDKKVLRLNFSELAHYLTKHPKREIRKSAADSLSKALANNSKTSSFILNTLLLDKKISDEIRHHASPVDATLLSYEVNQKTVNTMTSAIEKNYFTAERFYKAKKRILKLESLHEWDRYSSLFPQVDKQFTWVEAKELVLESFAEFSPIMHDTAKLFFDKRWIDAGIYTGKVSGGYCSLGTPKNHPYILMNFTGQIRDVSTLAHELGHGIHAYLSREQNLYEFHPSTAVAEIASIFAESIVFDKLYSSQTNKKLKINMLGDKLQEIFATVFRQNAFFLFEKDIHAHRREKGELSTKEFGDLFQKRLQDSFGNGVILTENHKLWWAPIAHFYHYNFYVFTYCFGELLTLALYSNYKQSSKSFIDNYLKALSLGGSLPPNELTKMMGIDIGNPNFWSKGLGLINSYVDEFEKLAYNS